MRLIETLRSPWSVDASEVRGSDFGGVLLATFFFFGAGLVQHLWVLGIPVAELEAHFVLLPGLLGASVGLIFLRLKLTDRRLVRQQEARAEDYKHLSEARQEALDAARAASDAKGDFLANMSHEIRTPMHGVLGMAEVLRTTDLDEQQRRYVATIVQSGEAMVALLNDILDISRIEARGLQLESIPFDLEDCVESVLPLFASRVDEVGVELLMRYAQDAPRRVIGDPFRVRQIVTNLVGNAAKFTESGHVLVEVLADELVGGRVPFRLRVEDTGAGIEASKLSEVFHAFTQADSTVSRRFGGAGLGLAIAGRLADLMGGRIEVESTVGEGSCFTVHLPLTPEGGQERSSPGWEGAGAVVAGGPRAHRVFVVEQLVRWGMRARDVVDTAGALAMLRAAERDGTRPWLLIAHASEQLDPVELGRALRVEPEIAPDCLVLVASAKGDGPDAELLAELGFAGVLYKPVTQSDQFEQLMGLWDRLHGKVELLPVAPAAAAGSAPAPKASQVLLVEDHAINRTVGVSILQRLGCSVDVAVDGREAVDSVLAGDYDLVLMDLHMPELDGIEATRAIRAGERGRRTPIVALTAAAFPEDRERCLRAGMDDMLPKPLRMSTLDEMLRRYSREPDPGPALDAGPEPSAVCDLSPWMELFSPEEVRALSAEAASGLRSAADDLRAAAVAGDCPAAAEAAHVVQGLAAELRAVPLRAAARAIEASARGCEPAAVRSAIDELDRCVSEVLAAVDRQVPLARAG